MKMKLALAALLLLLTPAAANARETLCGNASAAGSQAEVFAKVRRQTGQPPVLDEVKAEFTSADGAFGLRTIYDLTEGELGSPRVEWVVAYMPLPNPDLAPLQRIEWRVGDGPWSGQRYTDRPRRRSDDPARIDGYLWGRPTQDDLPALSLAIARNEPIILRRLDHDGATLAESTVRIPTASVTRALNAKARASALAALKACPLPPLMIPPIKQ